MMRLIAAAMMLGLAATAQAEEMCGKSKIEGAMEVDVWVSQQDANPPRVTWAHVDVWTADRTYRLGAHYLPSGLILGPPTSLQVHAYMTLPEAKEADPEQIVWRAGSAGWSEPVYWATPRPAPTEADPARGEVDYRLAQAPPLAFRTELLEAVSHGARIEFKRLDAWEREIGSGSLVYPMPHAIEALYRAARATALAKMRPCGGKATSVIPAAPPTSPTPAAPERPAILQAKACTFLRSNAQRAARDQPRSGNRMKIVAQPVDCGARTVRRIYETEGISKADRKELGDELARLSERMWCSDKSYRSFLAQGWMFSVELRATDDPAVYTATTRVCRN